MAVAGAAFAHVSYQSLHAYLIHGSSGKNVHENGVLRTIISSSTRTGGSSFEKVPSLQKHLKSPGIDDESPPEFHSDGLNTR